jgi:hypothetical protein
MAMTIFLALNGLGVIFLLYVLAQFWKEGQRHAVDVSKCDADASVREWVEVLVTTHPVSHSAQGGLPVIPFPARDREQGVGGQQAASRAVSEFPARRISTR